MNAPRRTPPAGPAAAEAADPKAVAALAREIGRIVGRFLAENASTPTSFRIPSPPRPTNLPPSTDVSSAD